MNRQRSIILASLIGAAIAAGLALGVPRAEQAATPEKEPNSRVVADPDGRRMMVERWPMGSPENVMHLRIPLGYNWGPLSSALAASPAFARDPNIVGPYTQVIILQALLPDFQPKTPENAARFTNGISGEVVRISLSTNVRSQHRGAAIVDVVFRHTLPMVVTAGDQKRYGVTFAPKPPRFELERMGPVGDFEQFRRFGYLSDIYYPAHDPKDVYIVCGAEEIRDVTEDPGWNRRPLCEHNFYSPTLDALVKIRYRRIYLADWRRIQSRAEALFKTFEIVPIPARDRSRN